VRLRNPMSVLRARWALARLLRAQKHDAVVCHGIWTYCIFSSVVARAGHPPVLYLHDIPDPKTSFYRWAWRRPPALCIVNSKATAAPLDQLRPSVPVCLVHPLVKPPPHAAADAVERLRTQFRVRSEELVILQASRFESWKGHRTLLQALGAMREVPGWRCWIAGAPQRPHEEAYRQELERLIDSLQIGDRVDFIGHRDDMATALAACDVYCQPNETPEPFGMVFVEAMYAGKPVIGRALGGALEVVTSDCGILCPAGAEALAAALKRLLGDGQLRKQMAQAGPARATALSGPEQFGARFRAALESLPNARARY
jgi:glycosyltransferase involved in cell wall biosynthesis